MIASRKLLSVSSLNAPFWNGGNRARNDPSLRISAAWLAIEDGAYDRALVHVHAWLHRKLRSHFRRAARRRAG